MLKLSLKFSLGFHLILKRKKSEVNFCFDSGNFLKRALDNLELNFHAFKYFHSLLN